METEHNVLSGMTRTCYIFRFTDMMGDDFTLLAILVLWIWSGRDPGRAGRLIYLSRSVS